jgi:23S rRNA (adenine2030-N6)-methyltransferase
MNYRHHFHAGNFADVMKHALLVQLVRALQKKDKGFLYLDTHAGRGSYDLTQAAQGDSLARRPEWPDGIGRICAPSAAPADKAATQAGEAGEVPEALNDYLELVRRFDRAQGNAEPTLRFYPGSPSIVRLLARMQDRLVLCEQHPEEQAVLQQDFVFAPRTTVQLVDGYGAVRAVLPPPERRALVLIDPPFEQQDELAKITGALREGLARLAGGVFCIWYPLTERARADAFFAALTAQALPPTLALELTIAGDASPLRMRGCGLVIVNPPWQFERTAGALLEFLAPKLAQAPGARARTMWLVPES